MAQFAAFQSLSSASCFLGQPRLSSTAFRLKVSALPSRLHAREIRCNVEDLSPKELHQIRKKEFLKKLRKVRQERRAQHSAEELARIPQVKPNPAVLKFESGKPLLNWNKPWRKKKVFVPKNKTENPHEGLGFEQGNRLPRHTEVEASSSVRWEANSELPESLWKEFEAVYEEKMKRTADGFTDGEVAEISVDETRDFEGAHDRHSGNSPDRSAEVRLEHSERYNGAEVVGEGRDSLPGREVTHTGSNDNDLPREEVFLDPLTNRRRAFSKQVERTEAAEFRENGDLVGSGSLGRDVSRNKFENSPEATKVIREERISAGGDRGIEERISRGAPRIVIGQRKGKDVYLSMGDDDATVLKQIPRSELNEEKQIEWLATQLNAVARPDGVHFSRLIRSGGLKITDGRSVTLVQKLGELGNWRCALQVVEWLSSRNRFPAVRSRYVATTLLAVLGKARRPVESLNIFNGMREHLGTYPDIAAYHIIAVTLGQAGYLEELLELMQILRQGPDRNVKFISLPDNGRLFPDIVVYNAALNACVPHRHWRLALWLLDQIHKEKNLSPNSASYGLAIEVMVKAGKFDIAWKILGKMELGGFHPNSLTYKSLVVALGQAGKADLAVQMVKQMEDRGIVAEPAVYYALGSTLCMCGRWQDALLQVDRIRSLSARPLVLTYTGLIRACKESGHWRDAISLFEHMRGVCAPNIGTYNIMISVYGAHNMYEEAKNLFDQIKKGRISPPKLFRSDPRLSPDEFTYNAMLGACTNAEKWDDLGVLFRQMLLQGYQMNGNRHSWIVQALSEAGKDDLVAAMFSHLRSLNAATAELYVLMIKSCLSQGEQDKAFTLLEEMVDLNIRIGSSDLQKIQSLAFLVSEEDQSNFTNKVESLKNTSDFNFAKNTRLLDFAQQRSSASKQVKARHSLWATYGGSEGINASDSTHRSLQRTSSRGLALGRGQDESFETASSRDCLYEALKGDYGKLEMHQDGLQTSLIAPAIPGWELLWRHSSQRQPTSKKIHSLEQLAGNLV